MDNYNKFLLGENKKFEGYEPLIKYLKNFWFKKNNKNYNYSNFIKKYFTNKKALEKLYVTNSIRES